MAARNRDIEDRSSSEGEQQSVEDNRSEVEDNRPEAEDEQPALDDAQPDSNGGESGVADEVDEAALRQLLSEDQGVILDRIDQLRGLHVPLPLPQIIVCGDQSSGKSSVLEAISRLPFPKGNGLCTTFPTELVLRRGPAKGPEIKFKPAPSRSQAEKDALADELSMFTSETFETVFSEAKRILQTGAAEGSYFEDILHVEVHNPAWAPLTLVDLPGIIHFESSRQPKGSAKDVQKLVRSYMERENTVILAVVPANNDLELQLVLQMVHEVDPTGKRTLGIITKPDLLPQGDVDQLQRVLRWATNQEHHLDLGWHVVKNPGAKDKESGLDERDRREEAFFSQEPWHGSLKPEDRGINALRTRLSSILMDITRPALPRILEQIRTNLRICNDELTKLGNPRSSRSEKLAYISRIAYSFDGLLHQAVRGDYTDNDFFVSGLPAQDPRRLRAAVENLSEEFAEAMHALGHSNTLTDNSDDYESNPASEDEQEHNASNDEDPGSAPNAGNQFRAKYNLTYNQLAHPRETPKASYFEHVAMLAAQNRGNELPGIPKNRLIGEVFREYSKSWETIASTHIEAVWKAARASVRHIVEHVASSETAKSILRHVIDDKMEEKHEELMRKLHELLKPYRKYDPITYNRGFFDSIHNVRQEGFPDPDSFRTNRWLNIDLKTADVTVGYMLAYYEIAIRTFIDNVATLAVEQCLLDGLTDIFNPNIVVQLSDQELDRLTSESVHTRERRQTRRADARRLQEAIRIVSRSTGDTVPLATAQQAPQPAPPPNDTGASRSARSPRNREESMPQINVHHTSDTSEGVFANTRPTTSASLSPSPSAHAHASAPRARSASQHADTSRNSISGRAQQRPASTTSESAPNHSTTTPSLFGGTAATSRPVQNAAPSTGLFGGGSSGFGPSSFQFPQPSPGTGSKLFGSGTAGSIFSGNAGGNVFGTPVNLQQTGKPLFGATPSTRST